MSSTKKQPKACCSISKVTLRISKTNNCPTKKRSKTHKQFNKRFSTLHCDLNKVMPTGPSKASLQLFALPLTTSTLPLIHNYTNASSNSLSLTSMSSSSTMLILSVLHLLLISALIPSSSGNTCRSYCGNITIDYPFALHSGCGHPGFRDLLYCINNVLMFHISSGSYRVLDIDYAYQSLTLHDPHMSTCDTIVLGAKGNGFAVEQWRVPYMNPTADNVFMLIGCSAQSPLFQGFPGKHLPCRNVSGMSCEEYYGCPAWALLGHREVGSMFGSGPPECCAVPYEAIKSINLTKLQCEGYSSAYSLAPLRVDGAGGWSYGIRVKYSVQENDEFCRACEATGGTCGYGTDGIRQLCMCGSSNSTSNCDSVKSSSRRTCYSMADTLAGLLACVLAWITKNHY